MATEIEGTGQDTQQIEQMELPPHHGLWLPPEVRACTALTPSEKELYSEIHFLSTDGRKCYATNGYLTDFLGLQTKRGMLKILARLKELGLVSEERSERWDGSFQRYLHTHPEKFKELPKRELKFMAQYYNKKRGRKDFHKGGDKQQGGRKNFHNGVSCKTQGVSCKTPVRTSGLFTSKGSKDPRGSDEPPYKLAHDLMDVWNELEGGPKHHDKSTKVHKRSIKYLQQLAEGTFWQDKVIDKDWMADQQIPTNLLVREWADGQISPILLSLSKLYVEGHWPLNKSKLPTSLPSLLHNPRTGRSFFLKCAADPSFPPLLSEEIDPTWEPYMKPFINLGVHPHINLVDGIVSIVQLHKSMSDRNALYHFPTPLALLRDYARWLDAQAWITNVQASIVKVDCQPFRKYVRETEEDLNCKIMEKLRRRG